jgi:hypothetical protein
LLIPTISEHGNLFKYLEDNNLQINDVLEWARHIASAMKYLHQDLPRCIIHRYLVR